MKEISMVATEYHGIYFYCKTNSRLLTFNRWNISEKEENRTLGQGKKKSTSTVTNIVTH